VRSGHLKPLQKITATSVDIRHFVAGALKGFGFGKRNQTGELPPPPPPSAPLALTPFFVVFWAVRGYSNCKLQNDRAYFALFRWVDRLNLLATPVAEIAGQIPDLRLARSGPAWPTFYPDLGGIMP